MDKIKIGIFGYCRGASYVDSFLQNNAEIVAVCDKRKDRLANAKNKLGNMVTCYEDFDSFIEHDMNVVFLANYFHEHTPYILKCFERNIHVLCECISNATMAEGVQLVEAAEKSKSIFMLAENYPYMLFNQEMKKLYEGGTLGKCLYAEGEYNHPGKRNDDTTRYLYDSTKHWRCYVPKTYYVTHSLAPIMFATGANPIRVTAMPIFHPVDEARPSASYVGDKAAIITTLNDDASVFRFTGHATFGGEVNSYRLCCTKATVENVRGTDGKVMLHYNWWEKPEEKEAVSFYKPEWAGEDAELIKKAGHGGGDFCVAKEFIKCVRENKPHPFDIYFSTRMSSVAILGHRSLLEYGVPYDIPDFKNKADRDKYRNDWDSPFYYSDGRKPTIPACSRPDFKPSENQVEEFIKVLNNQE